MGDFDYRTLFHERGVDRTQIELITFQLGNDGGLHKNRSEILISFLEVYINPFKIYRGYFRTPCNRTVLHNKFSTRSSGRSSRLVSSLQSITLVISALHYSISLWLGWNVTFPPVGFREFPSSEVYISRWMLDKICVSETAANVNEKHRSLFGIIFFKGKYLPTQVSTLSRVTTMG